jgi:hypothetical protein
LTGVHAGQNEIHAYAPELGYPDNFYAVFQTGPVPVINVKEGVTTNGVVVQLGPKPGRLTGEVVDERTGKPLPEAAVTLTRADRPEFYIRSSVEQRGTFAFDVPNHPLLISVSCSGYRDWKSSATTVSSGGSFHLAIAMKR